jgi:serine/threonine protein kinase
VALFHNQHLVHHDLKPGNIFIDERFNAILGDFGETRKFTMDHTGTMTALGSMLYMAPEVVKNKKCVAIIL